MKLRSGDAWIRAGLLACLVTFVLGARWAVVDRFGTDLPNWDQWDAEGVNALAPWKEHRFSLEVLARPQKSTGSPRQSS